MRIIEFYPSQGSFSPGQPITFLIELENSNQQDLTLRIFIQHLDERPVVVEQTFQAASSTRTLRINWTPPVSPAGYFARLEILTTKDCPVLQATTAFDVLSTWMDFPRYGFLTDFSPSRPDPETVLKKLTRFHLNGLQFYDWQYRHDQLLAPTEEYMDPLGRDMSLGSVRDLVDVAHKHGMAAMPYLAIYAASADFWRAHPDWALYDETGSPIAFGENFLGLMDPSSGSFWSRHLLAECARTLTKIPFDGLHIDQYGDPKQAWDSHQNVVDLPRAFVDFIQAVSDQHPGRTILFNAVGNWPIKELAASAVHFLYIEVWPPDVEYRHLAGIVLNAIKLSHGKPVVIALYLPANRTANNLLADAIILACGGTRIELGEEARLLSDPYFPRHEELSPELQNELQRLADFTIRNGEWLRPYTLSTIQKEAWSNGELNSELISTDNDLWTVIRNFPESFVIQFINFSGLDPHQRWDEPHLAPKVCHDVSVKIQTSHCPTQVFWDCPEQTIGPQALHFEYSQGMLTFRISQINFIGLVAIHE